MHTVQFHSPDQLRNCLEELSLLPAASGAKRGAPAQASSGLG